MNANLTRTQRTAGFALALSLVLEAVLSSCVPPTGILRSEEDAWLLSIAGYYQLTGELPAAPTEGVSKVARLAATSFQPPEPKTPSEAWALIDYYSERRAAVEQEASAQNLPPETVAKALAEYDAKIKALADKAQELEQRRARHRGTIWKRFFDGVGRVIGRAFDIGGRIVKFAIEDVPSGVAEYVPPLVKGLAQAYVEKLRGELRTRGEEKAFEILAEKNPNLAGAYLIFKAGKSAVKALRDFARLFGRHGGRASARSSGGDLGLPAGGMLVASCSTEWYHRWSTDPNRTILEESFDLVVDYETRTFNVEFYGQDRTVGEDQTQTIADALSGSGTVSEDGFLTGTGSWDRTFTSSPPSEGSPGTTSASIPVSWVGIIRDGLQRVDIEFCRGDEAVPSLTSLQSDGRAAFPAGFACQYIFACIEE